MPEQIAYYHDVLKTSPFCHRVEIALVEAGATFTSYGFPLDNKPDWYAQINPLSGKVPAITYGGPSVPPNEPSQLSFKLTESLVILEFLADLFPDSGLLPPASDPIARARVRFLIDAFIRYVETPVFEISRRVAGAVEKLVEGMEKIQALLPDPDAPEGGEYAIGKHFTNADCAIASLLMSIDIAIKINLWDLEPGTGMKLGKMLADAKFERLARYKKALSERESVKKVVDLERMESAWRVIFARK